MRNYKQMYLKMFRASEDAVNMLIAAQQECEELYVNQPALKLKQHSMHNRSKSGLRLKEPLKKRFV